MQVVLINYQREHTLCLWVLYFGSILPSIIILNCVPSVSDSQSAELFFFICINFSCKCLLDRLMHSDSGTFPLFLYAEDHINISPYLSYVSGALAGCAATVGSYPFDLLRTILASQGEPKVMIITHRITRTVTCFCTFN